MNEWHMVPLRVYAGRICLGQGQESGSMPRLITSMNFALQSNMLGGHVLISNNAALANNIGVLVLGLFVLK